MRKMNLLIGNMEGLLRKDLLKKDNIGQQCIKNVYVVNNLKNANYKRSPFSAIKLAKN